MKRSSGSVPDLCVLAWVLPQLLSPLVLALVVGVYLLCVSAANRLTSWWRRCDS